MITYENHACSAKMATCGLQKGTYKQSNNIKSDGSHNITRTFRNSNIRGGLVLHLN